jgi:aromatic-L-amino-acid decarboxylase
VALAQQFDSPCRVDGGRVDGVQQRPIRLVTAAQSETDRCGASHFETIIRADPRDPLSHTEVRGVSALRSAVGATATRQEHVAAAWTLLCQAADIVDPPC